MVMEAMRLSLLDHEDRLRRDADNRNGKDGTSTTAAESSSQAVPIGGPSNLADHGPISNNPTPSSSAPISSTSSTSSSSSGPSGETLNRSIEAGTAPSNPIAALQDMNDTSTAWR